MPAHNVLLEHLSVERLGLGVVAGESLLVVRNKDTAIGCSLHRTKDTVAGGGSAETDVQVALERTRFVLAN